MGFNSGFKGLTEPAQMQWSFSAYDTFYERMEEMT